MASNETFSDIEQWRQEEVVLGEMGKEFSKQATRINVRIPHALAVKALAAWQRDDEGELSENESAEDRLQRHRSGTLALIGLCIENGVTEEDDGLVTVEVDAWQIGDALNAADDLGLL